MFGLSGHQLCPDNPKSKFHFSYMLPNEIRKEYIVGNYYVLNFGQENYILKKSFLLSRSHPFRLNPYQQVFG